MSAIGAIFDAQGVPDEQAAALLDALGETPHDAAGKWTSGPMALAACILHTTVESRDGTPQPIVSEDGQLAAVLDGYLLNPQELTADLAARGALLDRPCDAEIALAAYRVWGEGCADRLLGEFSLIVADWRQGHLFAARDHMGLIPLYYRQEKDRLIMASDFRTLAALCREPLEPDREYLAQVLCNRWFLREATPWRGVKRLIRAHTMTFNGRAIASHNYWVPPTDITIRYKRDEDYVEHYRDMVFDCVKRASRSDRTVGIAVSGGLDSSALFSIADRLEKRGQWDAPGFAGYSLAAQQGTNAWELPFARAAADNIGRTLTEVPLFDPDIDWYTHDAQRHLDLPSPSNGAMTLDLEKRVVADGSRVIINGSGADQWLQGNAQYYREFASDFDIAGFWNALRQDSAAFGWSDALRQSARQAAAELTPGPLRRFVRRRLREQRRRNRDELFWLSPAMRNALARAEDEYEALLPENAIQWAKRNLAITPFSDLSYSIMRRQRAAIGLTSRHPMLSRAFMEFSLQTPAHIKRKGGITKVVHRQAMVGILPQVILDRTSKANFTNARIDQQFADYVRRNGADRLAGMCDENGLNRLLSVDFSAPEGDYWAWEIWGLYASAAFLYQSKHVAKDSPTYGQ